MDASQYERVQVSRETGKMTVAIQHGSNDTQESDSVNPVNANLHFSVSEALTESRLLERVREYRRLCLEIDSVNSDLSDQQLAHRADIMLQLKQASEHFNALLSPVDVVHMQVLRQLKLEQILSKYYWHTLFLANNHPEQGKYELDSLCSKLLNAKYSLSVVGFDVVNSAVEIDADEYEEADGKPLVKTQLPTLSPEALSAVTPKPARAKTTNESREVNVPDSELTALLSRNEPDSIGPVAGVVSSAVTGLCALLLAILAASVFIPDLVQKLQTFMPVGSWSYRLIMLVLLLTLTTSIYMIISKAINTNTNDDIASSSKDEHTGLFNELLNMNATPGRIFTAVVAPVLIGLGLGVATSAGFGSFGFALLLESLNKALFVPFWIVLTIVTASCCVLAWLWGRVPFGLGTLVALLVIGPAISVGVGFAPVDPTITDNIIALFLGLILFAGGISLAAASALGPDGVTALSLAAERMHQLPVFLSIVLWDLTAIAAGVILGGSIGIATVVGLIAVPFLIRLFLPAFRRVLIY